MKINHLSNSVDISEDMTETLNYSIDEKSMGIFFKSFSSTIYSDKIGSIVREIVSNAIDANIENNVDSKDNTKFVIVKLKKVLQNSNGTFIVKDFGPGMSPERIDIYAKVFGSTKRLNNEQIGGFGTGAKCPLAYTKNYTVFTIHNGIKYTYLVYKGKKTPQISLISKEETLENSGTEVHIPIHTVKDYYTFEKAIETQLKYFDNINFIIPEKENLYNNFKIFKGKHWIHRLEDENDTRFNNFYKSDYTRKINQLEVCLGKVVYPINWDIIINSEEGKNIQDYNGTYVGHIRNNNCNFALYFDIGELNVILSREALEYDEKTIKAIIQKIDLARRELDEIKKEQEIVDSIKELILLDKDNIRINDKGVILNIYNFLPRSKPQHSKLPNLYKDNHYFNNSELLTVLRISTFIGFNFLSSSDKNSRINRSLYDILIREDKINNFEKNKFRLVLVNKRISPKKIDYLLDTYGPLVILKKENVKNISNKILKESEDIKKEEEQKEQKEKEIKNGGEKENEKQSEREKVIALLIKEFNILEYENISISEEWELNNKKRRTDLKLTQDTNNSSNKNTSANKSKTKGNSNTFKSTQVNLPELINKKTYFITVKRLTLQYGELNRQIINSSLFDLNKARGTVVYSFKEDKERVIKLMSKLKSFNINTNSKKTFFNSLSFIEVKKSDVKLIKDFKNYYSIDEFPSRNIKILQRLINIEKIIQSMNNYNNLVHYLKVFWPELVLPFKYEYSYVNQNQTVKSIFKEFFNFDIKENPYICINKKIYNVEEYIKEINRIQDSIYLISQYLPKYSFTSEEKLISNNLWMKELKDYLEFKQFQPKFKPYQ